ncbi:MAG: PAS domain-containing protein, partial [Gemmatimonadota bacterium]|nr:PAS domain-containing protein [Gemmatimonadota bacterium]
MRARCRAFDWSATPLGATTEWPQSLRTIAATVLGSGFPMVLLWGPELIQLYNDGYVAFLAAKHPGGLGQRTRDCWPETWDINAPIYERVRAGETVARESARYPMRRQGPGGPSEDLFITSSYSPVPDESGEIAGVLVTLFDRTAEVQTRQLETERARLASALDAAPARLLEEVFRQAPTFLAVYHGPRHVYALANDAYYQLIGHGRDILGKPILEALPEVAGQGFDVLLDTVLRTGEPFVAREIPVRLERTPGAIPEDRVVSLTYLPLVDAAGERVGVIAHGSDVTEHVVARRELERINGERAQLLHEAEVARNWAESANRAKGEFLAVMSHELRTPLNAIGGYTELIAMGVHGPVTTEQRGALERIQHSQRHLLALINSVLNFAKVDAGAVSFAAEDELMDEVLAAC